MPWWWSKWCRVAGVIVLIPGAPLRAQTEWNTPAALALAERARDRRLVDRPDSGLATYAATARGFVLFLAQVGDPASAPTRLVKADQLGVEVYWRAPGESKQIIQAWRDGRWLPTNIRYHRDHLGIVTNDFGPRIRIGEGDEVRDVPHPLSAEGAGLYDFALGDSVTITTGSQEIRVRSLLVRPRSLALPGVIGILYLDAATAAVVRFRFGFTAASYLDSQLTDITILLDNALIEERWWLPVHQVMEIRRHLAWLDFPAQSIIRGRWTIGDYRFNDSLPSGLFRGPTIGGLAQAVDSGGSWPNALAEAVDSEAPPVGADDLARLRAQVSEVVDGRVLERIRPARLGVDGVSDLIHFNRVQGLTLGGGFAIGAGSWRVLPKAAYGFSDQYLTGTLALEHRSPGAVTTLSAGRALVDFSDLPAASGIVNTISAAGWADDAGDYVRLDRAALTHRRAIGSRATLSGELAVEHPRTESVNASPASGSFRANPALGAGTYELGRLAIERVMAPDLRRDWGGAIGLEAGNGDRGFARVRLTLSGQIPAGTGTLGMSLYSGVGSAGLPAYRSFALGGKTTLPGEDFRVYGGRVAMLARLEWRVALPAPAIPLGSYASTGNRFTFAPFVAAGWTGGGIADAPWQPSPGVRPVAGVAAEFFLHLIRLEAGVGLRTGRLGVSLDVAPAWWPVL